MLSFFILSQIPLITFAEEQYFNIRKEKVIAIGTKYGYKAKKRIELWDKIIQEAKSKNIFYKLKDVNDFWNKVTYKKDSIVWNKKDYWAKPFEFLAVGAGDSEDFAMAKYFSLLKLGIPYKKLRVIYVKLLNKDEKKQSDDYVVLTYLHKPDSIPVVLDRFDKRLKLATDRKDIELLFQ